VLGAIEEIAAEIPRRCHNAEVGKGKRVRAKRTLAGRTQSSSSKVPGERIRAQLPRPNVTTFTNVTVVPVFPADHPLGKTRLPPSGSPGNYKVNAVLGVPGISPSVFTDMNWDEISANGDSLLEAPPGVAGLTQEWQIGGPGGQRIISYEFTLNNMRRLATGSTLILAEGFRDALAAASDVLESYLSILSFRYDIPAEVVAWRLTEEKTGSVSFAMKALGKQKLVDPAMALHTTPATRELLSTWREAVNAATPMGQALGFYKIIERVHKYRVERELATRDTERHYIPPRERMPASVQEVAADYENASDTFTPYIGMKFGRVWNEELRERIRNAVAHLREDAPSLTADRSADMQTCRETVPVLHYIARTMLQAEISDQPTWPELYAETA
jgi:hypothetical protein